LPTFTSQQLQHIGIAILEGAGVPRPEAVQVVDLLVESNLVGHDSHGVVRIPDYVYAILEGKVKPEARIEVVRESCTTAVVNGNWGLGQVVASQTMSMAISKAEEHDIGIVTTFNCGHIGRLADYAQMAVAHDMIGYCCSNSLPQVAPFGGMQRVFNQSPISWAIPAGNEPPFILDITTSVCAGGKIIMARAKGEKLPPRYIIDRNGLPTIDPEDYFRGGAGLPLGGPVGYKGTGLAMVVDITAGILSGRGAAYLGDNSSSERAARASAGQGVFQLALKVAAFCDVAKFKEDLDKLLRVVRNSKPAAGFKEVLVPGDLELRTRKIRLVKGIEIPQATWDEIIQTAKKVKVDISRHLG